MSTNQKDQQQRTENRDQNQQNGQEQSQGGGILRDLGNSGDQDSEDGDGRKGSNRAGFSFQINQQGRDVMDALGISPERCSELCTGIEEVASEMRERPFGEILQKTIETHTKNPNEVAFLLYQFGTHQGFGATNSIADMLFGEAFTQAHNQTQGQGFNWGRHRETSEAKQN